MGTVRTVVMVAAFTLAAGLLVPSTAAVAATPRALPLIATRTVTVDVDGDAAADTVTVAPIASGVFTVVVNTAAGELAAATLHSTIVDDWGIEPWYGAATLDGAKGHELLLLTSGGDGAMFRVLSWRSGTLVWEAAPKSLMKGANDWYLARLEAIRFGYRFTTSKGKRYVRDFELYAVGSRWKGTVVKSVWKAGAWTRLSTSKVTLTARQARAYNGITGVTLVATP